MSKYFLHVKFFFLFDHIKILKFLQIHTLLLLQGLKIFHRVDDFIYNGYTISPFYDSLIAKIIIKGKTRNESIQRSLRALEETFISGPDTNINLHKNILQDEDFKKNTYSTAFLQEKISSFEL